MKKFKYRLEALLKVKEHIEKERQKEHSVALRQVYAQQQTLEQIDSQKRQTLTKQSSAMTGKMSVAEMLIYSRYILKLKKDGVIGRELLKALRKTEREKRERLLEASRERKKYEKLRERKQEQFNETVRLQSAKENDEIAINNFRLKER